MFDRRLRHGLLRLSRGGFVALMTVTMSVGAHVHAGGVAPSGMSLVGLTALFAVACWALSGQRWTARPLLAVFVLAQVATHTIAMLEHPMHVMGGASMLPSHVAAAVLLVLMVTRGESTLVRLLEHLTLRCRGVRLVATPRRSVARVVSLVISRRPGRFVPTVRGRAPPVVSPLPVL